MPYAMPYAIPYAIPYAMPYRLSDAAVSIGVVDFASQATVISQLSTDTAAVSRPPAFTRAWGHPSPSSWS